MDLILTADLSLRLIVAAVAGSIIGIEREWHGHPAGMRTYLLVVIGSALFTILSIYGFQDQPGIERANVDPSRVAAQIVSGIGFLCAGAIFREGFTVRGLTTAASIWAAAAIGVGAGAGAYEVTIVAALLVFFVLGPMNAITDRLMPAHSRVAVLRIVVVDLSTSDSVTSLLSELGYSLVGLRIRPVDGAFAVEARVKTREIDDLAAAVVALLELPGVTDVETVGGAS